MDARYVFGVQFRLEPESEGVSVEPATFETKLYRAADPPGEEGWLFFRDNFWRGELGDERHFRELTEEMLGVTILSVDFRSLQIDEEYRSALEGAIDADLELFKADSVSEVLNKYLGSSIEVV